MVSARDLSTSETTESKQEVLSVMRFPPEKNSSAKRGASSDLLQSVPVKAMKLPSDQAHNESLSVNSASAVSNVSLDNRLMYFNKLKPNPFYVPPNSTKPLYSYGVIQFTSFPVFPFYCTNCSELHFSSFT